MKKTLFFLCSLLVVMSCKTKEKALVRVKDFINPKEAMEALAMARPVADRYHIRGTGTFSQGGDGVSFRFDLRMKTDSAMWIEVSDPVLGIRAARLLATKDTVVIVNLIEGYYQKMAVDQLLQDYPVKGSLQMLENTLLGLPSFGVNPSSDSLVGEGFGLVLKHNMGLGARAEYFLEGQPVRMGRQSAMHQQLGSATVKYGYKEEEGIPLHWMAATAQSDQKTLDLVLKYDLIRTEAVRIPSFQIPQSYVRK